MTWEALLPLVTRYGIEFAMQYAANHANKVPVTPESLEALKLLARPYDEIIAAGAARAAATPPTV